MKTVRNEIKGLFLIVAVGAAALSPTLVRAGNGSSGGGTTCTNPAVNQGQAELLDFADSRVNDPVDSGTRLQSTKVADTIGFDNADLSTNAAARLAIAQLESWKDTPGSQQSMALVEQGLTHLNFYITPLEIHRLSRVALPENSVCNPSDLRTTILYRDGSASISIPAWNQLGLLSQAGMFVHEALRNVQILQQLDGTDLDLERVTLTIMAKAPGSVKLDEDVFFRKYVIQSPQDRLKLACAGLRSFLAKNHPEVTPNDPIHTDTDQLCNMTLSNNGNEKQELDAIRGVEKDLTRIARSSADVQTLVNLNQTYARVDDLVSALVHQLASRDDFKFRDLTSSMHGVSTQMDLDLIRDFLNGKIEGSKSSEIQARLAQVRAEYQHSLENESAE